MNLHDNDLMPIDATPADRDRIVKDFIRACRHNGIMVPMTTVNLFFDPVFRDGAFTANDDRVRVRRSETCGRWISARSSAQKIFVLWGGREGTETDVPSAGRSRQTTARGGQLLSECRSIGNAASGSRSDQADEPWRHLYATTGAYLRFIATLDHRRWSG